MAQVLTRNCSGGSARLGTRPRERPAPVHRDAGEVVLDQGEPATEVFAVISGQLEVNYRDALGAERLVSSLGGGDTFGEIALLNGGLRTSVVRAVTTSELVASPMRGSVSCWPTIRASPLG